MNVYTIKETTLIAIGDAIRAKNGTNNTYTSEEFATAIEAIVATGGGEGGSSGGPGVIEHVAVTGVANTDLSYQYDLTPYMNRDFYFLNWIRTTSGVDPYLQHFIYHAATGTTESLSFANNPLTATKANASKSMGSLVNGILTLECYNSSYMVQKTSHLFVCNGGSGEGGGIVPEGEIEIKENGDFDVTEFASAHVAVPVGVFPSGELPIAENGDYDVTQYANAHVAVPVGVFPSGDLAISANGKYTVTDKETVTVLCPTGITPSGTKEITVNGNYDVTNFERALVNVPTGGADVPTVTLSGSCDGACNNKFAAAYLTNFPSKVVTQSISNADNMFSNVSFTTIPIELNFVKSTVSVNSMFYGAYNLTELPKFNQLKPSAIQGMFQQCTKLRDTSTLAAVDMSYFDADQYAYGGDVFSYCSSLRSVPSSFLKGMGRIRYDSEWSHPYRNIFYNCYNLDEVVDLGVTTTELTWNFFGDNPFYRCNALRRFTFETNADGTPKTARWTGQIINLTARVGWGVLTTGGGGYNYYNSGRSYANLINDADDYAAKKNDPDRIAVDSSEQWSLPYATYNKASAIETIQSLPDTSGYGGNNTIKFRGDAGSATDEGAIRDMEQQYIDLAAAKGWTVVFE